MKNNLRRLCEGAIMVAIAQILSYIKLWEMPWGGSIVLAMVPIILFSVRWGLGSGLLAGFVFGVLQFMFDGGFAIGWQSIIGDYLLAFTVLGLAGLMKGKKLGVFWGTLIGALLMAVIRNGLNLAGAKNDVQYIVIGSVIILAVTIDVFRNKMEAKARKMAAQ